jgi:hypothetical protein
MAAVSTTRLFYINYRSETISGPASSDGNANDGDLLLKLDDYRCGSKSFLLIIIITMNRPFLKP